MSNKRRDKPVCKLVGEDGNVFNVIGRVCKALKRAGKPDEADEFKKKALYGCHSYDEVLRLVNDFVEVH